MFKKTAIILAALALSVGAASAATLQLGDGESFTLADILEAGSVQVEDKIFSNFVYNANDFDGIVDEADIDVYGLGSTPGDSNPGISFRAPWTTTSNATFELMFLVSVEGGLNKIYGSSLWIGGGGINTFVSVGETQCAGGLFSDPCPNPQTYVFGAFFQNPGNSSISGQIWYDDEGTPHSSVDVFKDISMLVRGDGFGDISRIDQRFYQRPEDNTPDVPEPTTMLLFSTALLGLGFMRRKKS